MTEEQKQLYAQRIASLNSDGTPLFCNQYDKRNEKELADFVGKRWNCEFHEFGKLSPIDWYVNRDERLEAFAELKCRTHSINKYPDVFLNLRKWLALGLGQQGTGKPSFFIVKFTDAKAYIAWDDIDARKISIAGCREIVKSSSDIEPVIHIPVDCLIRMD